MAQKEPRDRFAEASRIFGAEDPRKDFQGSGNNGGERRGTPGAESFDNQRAGVDCDSQKFVPLSSADVSADSATLSRA